MSRVVLIDTGGGNIGSLQAALARLGVEAPVSADPAVIDAAERLILPGVGAAAPAMQRLRGNGLDQLLRRSRQPLLGVCLGMQLLFEHSEEGAVDCLGLLPGRVTALRPATGIRLPHMGWNRLQRCADSRLLDGIADGSQVYFVHGFAVPVGPDCVASASHGQPFAALVERGHVAGAQFHPERSAAVGARLLENFLR